MLKIQAYLVIIIIGTVELKSVIISYLMQTVIDNLVLVIGYIRRDHQI